MLRFSCMNGNGGSIAASPASKAAFAKTPPNIQCRIRKTNAL
jgi:hypothetical protein